MNFSTFDETNSPLTYWHIDRTVKESANRLFFHTLLEIFNDDVPNSGLNVRACPDLELKGVCVNNWRKNTNRITGLQATLQIHSLTIDIDSSRKRFKLGLLPYLRLRTAIIRFRSIKKEISWSINQML